MQLLAPGNARVCTVKDVPADVFIGQCATYLKDSGLFEVPEWAEFVKTGCAKELCPQDEDFLYIRAASILRRMAFEPKACGVGKLRRVYGKSQNNGVAPSHRSLVSGKVIRYCIQQLQNMKLVEPVSEGSTRCLSSKGHACVDQIANLCKQH